MRSSYTGCCAARCVPVLVLVRDRCRGAIELRWLLSCWMRARTRVFVVDALMCDCDQVQSPVPVSHVFLRLASDMPLPNILMRRLKDFQSTPFPLQSLPSSWSPTPSSTHCSLSPSPTHTRCLCVPFSPWHLPPSRTIADPTVHCFLSFLLDLLFSFRTLLLLFFFFGFPFFGFLFFSPFLSFPPLFLFPRVVRAQTILSKQISPSMSA